MAQNQAAWVGMGFDAQGVKETPFMFLGQKGESVRLRIVSQPYRYIESVNNKPVKRTAFLAITREDINGTPVRRAVIFQTTPGVYDVLKKFHLDTENFGDLSTYDVVITRTEAASAYYAVEPLFPNGQRAPLGDKDKRVLEDSGLTVDSMIAAITEATEERSKVNPVASTSADKFVD